MNKREGVEDVQNQIAAVTARIEELKTKGATDEGLTPEENDEFKSLVDQLEVLKEQEQKAQTEQRYAEIKVKSEQPRNPAPRVVVRSKAEEPLMTHDEAKFLWIKGQMRRNAVTPEDVYRATRSGFDITGKVLNFTVNYNNLNYKAKQFAMKRTKMATVNVGAGKEWIYKTYDDQVVEYLLYESTFLSALDVKTISGSELEIKRVDNTHLESSYTSASGGSELNPTIPEKNLVSSLVTVKPQTITSGIFPVTWEELQDSYIDVPAEISKANGLSHKRKMEREILNGTGNGSTGCQGLVTAATNAGNSSEFTEVAIRAAVRAIPKAYRGELIIVGNDAAANDVYDTAVDDFGRSLFKDKDIETDNEFDTLAGHKFFVSEYMPDDTLLVFNPNFYKLVVGNVETFQFFEERYYPDHAWSGLMRFGGVWTGPSAAIQKITKSS